MNTSKWTWLSNSHFPINLGNHWRKLEGHVVTYDDGRAPVPLPLAPGKSVRVSLGCKARAEPGRYVLELGLVQESGAWFCDNGDRPASVTVEVTSRSEVSQEGVIGRGIPRMEMIGVPVSVVCADIEHSGGMLEAIFPDGSAGGSWNSHLYIVRKVSARKGRATA